LTDDEGWRFEVKALPNLTTHGAWRGRGEVIEPQYGGGPHRYGGFYSHADIREVVEYAADRGIDIVPEIDVPGHCYAAIRSLPGLLGKAVRRPRNGPTSVQNFKANVLDPESPATYEFLEAVFSEVLEVFPAPLGVHIGMDEIPRGAWSEDEAEEARLKAKIAAWLQDFLSSRGRALLGWEEAFYGTNGLNAVAEQRAVALAWKEDERTAVTITNAGYDAVLCPAHFLYLDIVQGMDFEDKGLYWATQALPIERVYAYEPLDRLARLGLREDAKARIRGVSANLWSETVDSPERAEEMLFPRLLAAAEVMWTQSDLRDWGEFQWRLAPNLVWLAREEGVRRWNQVRGILAGGNFLNTPRLPSEFLAEY
jgi:hexosaminidase